MAKIEGLKISYSGVRGIVGQGLDEEVARRFGQAFGKLVARRHSRPTILLARDTRPSGPALLEAVTRGVAPYAARLLDLGVVATPTAQFAMGPLEAQAAVVVTASHNPSEWNGFKFMLGPDNTVLDGEQTDELFSLYLTSEVEVSEPVFVEPFHQQAIEQHIARVAAQVGVETIRSAGFKVAVDSGGGAGEEAALGLLKELGCQVVRVQACRESEPTPESLTELGEAVRASGAQVGMAQDMDGDRLALVDETGNPLGEEATLLLVVDHLLRKHGPSVVVRNLSTTHAIDRVVRARGGRLVETRVGEVNLSRALAGQQSAGVCTFGGEGNGGVIYPPVSLGRDSLVGMAFILEDLAQSGLPISQRFAAMPQLVMLKEKLPLADPNTLEALYARVTQAFPVPTISRVDGLKLVQSDGSWLLLRPSNTEPVVRAAVESADMEWARSTMERVRALWTEL